MPKFDPLQSMPAHLWEKAESRAHEAGLTLSEWVSVIVSQHAEAGSYSPIGRIEAEDFPLSFGTLPPAGVSKLGPTMAGAVSAEVHFRDWTRIRVRLRQEMGEGVYARVFTHLKLDKVSAETVYLSVRNRYLKSRLQSRYLKRLAELWRDETGVSRKVEVSIRARPVEVSSVPLGDGPSHSARLASPADEDVPPSRLREETARQSALEYVAMFSSKIHLAAVHMGAVFEELAAVDVRVPAPKRGARASEGRSWLAAQNEDTLQRAREVRHAFSESWRLSGELEHRWEQAFAIVMDLASAPDDLFVWYARDRREATAKLAKFLDIAVLRFEQSASLLEMKEPQAAAPPSAEERFAEITSDLLERAGGGASLTEGARLLGISRQALHKRIKAGSALGIMHGQKLVFPRLQWVQRGEGMEQVAGLSELLPLFDEAGGWSALQFLIEIDPNLSEAPIDALRAGRVADVVAAARAYLGLDEG